MELEEKEHILYVTFNQDGTCFCVGTETGFMIYRSYPLKLKCKRDLGGGIGIIEMVGCSNIIALVGGGTNPKYDNNKVILWDDSRCSIMAEILGTFEIHNIRIKKTTIFIIGKTEINVFKFGNIYLKVDSINTCQNQKGIFGISLDPKINIICYPTDIGKITIKNYNIKNKNNNSYKTDEIKAHQSEIVSLVMNYDGSLLASASKQGTIIRIHQTKDNTLIQELRRGTKSSEIYSLIFDIKSQYLACSSNTGTIHIFIVKNEQNNIQNQKSIFGTITSFLGIQSEYLNSEWSFAQYRLEYKGKTVISFYNKDSIIVLTNDGKYYLGEFNIETGGECITAVQSDILDIDINDNKDKDKGEDKKDE